MENILPDTYFNSDGQVQPRQTDADGEMICNEMVPTTNACVRTPLVGPGGDNNVSAATAIDERMRFNPTLFEYPVHLVDDIGRFAGNLNMTYQDADLKSNLNKGVSRYSRKVFVGGLQHDLHEKHIFEKFCQFGMLHVDWPLKHEMKMIFPPKGFAFLLFQEEQSVQKLIDSCITKNGKLYTKISSPYVKDKSVQIRPWRHSDAKFVLDPNIEFDQRKTVFVGGVPRPLKAYELATIMDRMYGGVCSATIDIDNEYQYPRATGHVCFANIQSYVAAISARFIQVDFDRMRKRIEVKPDVRLDQLCDECANYNFPRKSGPYFCPNITCLKYFCMRCWNLIHSLPGREFHKTLMHGNTECPPPWMNY